MLKFIKNKKVIFVIVIVILIAIAIFAMLGKKEEKIEYVTAKVERGTLVQTVSETGTVKAAKEIDLNFLNSGRIAKILVGVGEKVKEGQVLAELDYRGLSIKEKEAQANLNKLLAGASREEIAVSEASAEQARVAYRAAVKELERVKRTVEENIAQAEKELNDLKLKTKNDITTYEQSIENKKADALMVAETKLAVANIALDNIDMVLTNEDIKYVISVRNTIYLKNTNKDYKKAEELLTKADKSLAKAKTNKTESNVNKALDDALAVLNKTFSALDNCFKALEYSITYTVFQTKLDAFKTEINTQLTAVSTGISVLQTAQQNFNDAILAYDTKIDDARDALATAQVSGEQQITIAENKVDISAEAWRVGKAQLAQLKAPARIQDVILAQAALELVQNQIENSIIKASIRGTIAKIEYEVGEQTLASQPAIFMLGENSLEIEVDISEADIAKVNEGDIVEITLDAFGDDVKFLGIVYFIEPAETVIQDVIYYKVKIDFSARSELSSDWESYSLEGVKSGMTANVIIITARKDNVLVMPSRAMIEKNGDRYARVLVNEQVQEVPITIDLRGDEGMVEVLSGVEEGDEVVTYVKKK